MRVVLVVVAATSALMAVGIGSADVASETALTITYWESGAGKGDPDRWALRCDPARGTLARPAVACRRLAEAGRKVFLPVPDDAVCTEIYGGPQVARVTGTLAGRRVWVTFSRRNGCQISRWDGVAGWLLPRAGLTR